MERSPAPSTSQLGLGIALAVGLVASTWTFVHFKMGASNHITVKGYAEKAVQAEYGVWKGTIRVRHVQLTDGYKEIAEKIKAVEKFVANLGFENANIELTPPKHEPIYKKTADGKNHTNEIERYDLSQTIVVKSPHVQSIQKLAGQASQINESGWDFSSDGANYYYPSDKLELIKLQMIAEATKNAHQRANQFATNSGSHVGRLVDARQGVFQVVAPYTSTSEYDRYDTSSVDKVVKLVVTLTYNVA